MLNHEVGPVLSLNSNTAAFLSAIRRSNPQVHLMERSSYIRILVPQRCILHRQDLDAELGHSSDWPGCLELMMPSFKGRLQITAETAIWSSEVD
jgi:hypothetical protein